MFGADVVVPKLASFLKGKLQNSLGARGERDFNGNEAGASADDFFNLNAGIFEVYPHRLEHFGSNASAFTDQPKQNLFSAHKVVAKAAGLLLGQHDHLDCFLGKPLEHWPRPGTSASKLPGLTGVVWFTPYQRQIPCSSWLYGV